MSKVAFSIRVDDCGGYYQVYEVWPDFTEVKIGNIYPPRYELFGVVQDEISFVAEHESYGKATWQNMSRALAYLISPRGMT